MALRYRPPMVRVLFWGGPWHATYHTVELLPWLVVRGEVKEDGELLYFQCEAYKAVKYGMVVDGELETWYEYHHVPWRED